MYVLVVASAHPEASPVDSPDQFSRIGLVVDGMWDHMFFNFTVSLC